MASRIRQTVSPTLLRFLAVGGVSYLVNQASLYLLYELSIVLAKLVEKRAITGHASEPMPEPS